jgi:hypothetical protein
MKHVAAGLVVAGALLAPLGAKTASVPKVPKQTPWQALITNVDRNRLKQWRDTWLDGLKQAEAAGFRASIDREGKLLDPDAAMEKPDVPDGAYHCRWIKLGRRIVWGQKTGAPFQIDAPVPCSIKGTRFRAKGGTLRPNGTLWSYDAARLLFLGGISVGDEAATIPYGRDPDRNALGLLERIGDHRWRLVLPHPAWEATIDVIEIVPG